MLYICNALKAWIAFGKETGRIMKKDFCLPHDGPGFL